MPTTTERLLARSAGLSALPLTAMRLLALTADQTVGPEELAAVMESDPALCADALRIANGALHAPVVPVTSLREACHRLGPRAISTLAANVAAFAAYQPIGAAKPQEIDFLWRHAVLNAVSAAHFAESAGLAVERAHVAGLLQNVAFLALAQADREVSLRVALSVRRGVPVIEAECAAFDGEHHGSLSAQLLAEAGLPPALLDLTRGHCAPAREGEDPLLPHLRKADALASAIMRDQTEDSLEAWWAGDTLPGVLKREQDTPELRNAVGFRALEILTLLG